MDSMVIRPTVETAEVDRTAPGPKLSADSGALSLATIRVSPYSKGGRAPVCLTCPMSRVVP